MTTIGRITRYRHHGIVNPPDWITGAETGDVVETSPGVFYQLTLIPASEVAAALNPPPPAPPAAVPPDALHPAMTPTKEEATPDPVITVTAETTAPATSPSVEAEPEPVTSVEVPHPGPPAPLFGDIIDLKPKGAA